jgi:hypothetical protein
MTPEKISLFGVPYKTWKDHELIFVWGYGPARRAEMAPGYGLGGANNSVLTIWAALLATNPTLTIEEAEEIIDAEAYHGRAKLLDDALTEAINKSQGKKKASNTEGNPPNPAV